MKKVLSILLATVMSMTLLAGCGNNTSTNNNNSAKLGNETKKTVEEKPAQGVTDDTIKIGTIGPVSGPVAVVGVPMVHGLEAYIDMINDEGGIDGRKIELISKDDGFKPDVALQKAEELVESDEVFAIVGQLGTPGCLSTIEYFKETGIPAVYQGSGSSAFSKQKENYFPVQPNYTMEGKLMTQFILDDLGAKSIAVIYENNDIGKEGIGGIKAKLEELGKSDALKVEVPYNPVDIDFSTHIQKLAEVDPDATIIYGNAKPTAGIVNEAKKQGFDTQFVASYIVADVTLFTLAKDAWNGAITAAWVPDITDASNEKAKLFIETFNKYFPDETPNAFAVAGWVAGEVFVEGLRRTEGALTWDNYIKAMESFENWNGGIAKGITYTPDSRNGVESMYFMKAKYVDETNFTYEVISDFIKLEN